MAQNPNSPNINLQPHLGRLRDSYKPHDNVGQLALAKVIKVHHKHNTVDLQLVKSKGTIQSSEEKEGRFGARVAVPSAHFNRDLMSSSGVVEPIIEGQLVILAFLDGYKSSPIVLGSFHETWDMGQNVLTTTYPLDTTRSIDHLREALKYLRVSPSQFYNKIDGIGGVEVVHPSKTFLKVDADFEETIDDSHNGFDHEDLSEKDPFTNDTRSARTEESLLPVKLLFAHRSNFEEEFTRWTKFFLDRTGSLRITRDTNDGKLTFAELGEHGSYKVRRQVDSDIHGGGSNFTELEVDENGVLRITRNNLISASITIDEDSNVNISQSNGSYIKMDANGDIIIRASGRLLMSDSTSE